jgi:oxygen-independent coproporphyrinogen III oxidase
VPIEHLYFHVPFCPKLCPYCCFYVEVGSANKNRAFLDALLREVEVARRQYELRPRTIYFGGGTPSALLTDQLHYLFEGLRTRLDLSQLEEFTLEANPATIRPDKARVLREGGVTRLSLGVQSWDDELLKTLGRVHNAEQAGNTVGVLREAGFDNLSLDLMFAVPGQSVDQWRATLEKTVSLRPEHISCYCLTYEEDTEYFRKLTGGQFVQDDERDAQLFELTMDLLGASGFHHYEISNHALPGRESRHNEAYWHGADYLGFGPSAFSTVGERRWENLRDTTEYTRRVLAGEDTTTSHETLSAKTRLGEIAAFALRTSRGMPLEKLTPWREEIAPLIEHGLLRESNGTIRLTRRGKLLADSVAEVFV